MSLQLLGRQRQPVPEHQDRRQHRQAPVIGEALLEAEFAGHEAADQLAAPGAEDGDEAEDERGEGRLLVAGCRQPGSHGRHVRTSRADAGRLFAARRRLSIGRE